MKTKITRVPWLGREDEIILNTTNEMRQGGLKSRESLDLAHDELQGQGYTGRTRAAVEKRYYQLMVEAKESSAVVSEEAPISETPTSSSVTEIPAAKTIEVLDAEDIIGSLEKFKNTMLAIKQENIEVLAENQQLKQRLAEASKLAAGHEEVSQNYQLLLRVIEQARKTVSDEELVKIDNKFKMARNGDLERIG